MADDIAKMETSEETLSDQIASLPKIVFPPNDAPDVTELRRLLDEATVWLVTHGNEVDSSLRTEVEEMIEEMEHILYYASSDDTSDNTATAKNVQLSPDSSFDAFSTTEIANTQAETSGTLQVSGSLAVAFFQERILHISSLQGNEGSAGKEEDKQESDIDTTEAPVREPAAAPVTESSSTPVRDSAPTPATESAPTPAAPTPAAPAPAAASVSEPVAPRAKQMQMDADSPRRWETLNAAFETLASGKPTSGNPETRKARCVEMDSDSTYVSLN